MRSYILLLSALMFVLTSCGSKDNNSNAGMIPADVIDNPSTAEGQQGQQGQARISFEKMEHDFGRLTDGEKVEYSFKFTNEGDADLLISNCYGSCGCTVPEWPSEPIKPGKSGAIKVIFDSKGRPGTNNKKVTVLANTNPRTTVLSIKAQVARK